jgi:hypothetical protein
VDLIVRNQQKPDESISNYLKKTICGAEAQDPKVCCPALVFASLSGTSTAPATMPPAPFIFSAISTQSQVPSSTATTNQQIPTTQTQQSTTNVRPPTSGVFTFSPIGSSTQDTTSRTTTRPPTTTPQAVVTHLPTNEANRCGMVYALKTRIVG